MTDNRCVDTRYGRMYYNINDMVIGASLQLYGEFFQAELDMLSIFLRDTSPNILDVGANIGTHTLYFAQLGGKVFSFEPQPKTFELLCANIVINNVTDRVTPIMKAVSNAAGHVSFNVVDLQSPTNAGASSIVDKGNYRVEAVPIDSLSLPKIDCIKVDVEGHELQVIQGARALIERDGPLLYVENNRPQFSKPLTEMIASMDYEIAEHRVAGFNPNNWNRTNYDLFGGYVETNLLCVPRSNSELLGRLRGLMAQQ